MTLPEPLDFAYTWQTYTQYNMHHRLSNENELAFWEDHATGYDSGFLSRPESYSETLNTICSMVRPDDTLLEVGAGSGRFTVPLAQHVHSITALDLSPHMLSLLRSKCTQQTINNINIVEADWEDAVVEPHDVVLAAWSLYRQRDILASLQKLVNVTRRTLIIVDGDYAPAPDDDPPHERLRKEIWGAGDPGISNYLYFAGMLRQLRVRAEVRVVYEQYHRIADTVLHFAQSLAPKDATAASIEEYARLLTPHVQQNAERITYTCNVAVGMVIWQRGQND